MLPRADREKNAPRNEHVAHYDQRHQNCTGNLSHSQAARLNRERNKAFPPRHRFCSCHDQKQTGTQKTPRPDSWLDVQGSLNHRFIRGTFPS